MSDYLPNFSDSDGNHWGVLRVDWYVDFGGRACDIEAQRENGDKKFPSKSFTIYGLSGEFVQHSKDEVCDSMPNKGLFYKSMMAMFKAFDTTGKVS